MASRTSHNIMTTPSKRVFIKTYGCQMNVYDSEQMNTLLRNQGYSDTQTAEDADLIILNTCHIREKAAEKVYSELGRMRPLKENRKGVKIAVMGCVAQAEGAEIMRRAPVVDFVLGPQSYHHLPRMLNAENTSQDMRLATDFEVDDKFERLAARRGAQSPAAFVTIQEGCDKFCAFCVVPYTRGAEHSRSADQITAEVRALVRHGVREVTLLGQNVNAWADPQEGDIDGLGGLIAHLAQIDGLARIRYTTSHPRDMDDGLIAAHANERKLMPYLHLPLQSGADPVLKAMNRGHTLDHYKALIARIRAARPDIALSSDFIVGFPGETDADFEATMQAVRDIGYASAYSFKYSPRPGTPGAARDDQIPEPLKAERLAALQELLGAQQTSFNASMIGQTLPVLLERPGRHTGQVCGRSPFLQSVFADAPNARFGTMQMIKIENANRNSLSGTFCATTDEADPDMRKKSA